MSVDYFALLAARTLGTGQRLGPLVPSRFDPGQDWLRPDAEAGDRLVPPAAVRGGDAAWPRGPAAPRVSAGASTHGPPAEPQAVARGTPPPEAGDPLAAVPPGPAPAAPPQAGARAGHAATGDAASPARPTTPPSPSLAPDGSGGPIMNRRAAPSPPSRDAPLLVPRSVAAQVTHRRAPEPGGGDRGAPAGPPAVIVRIGRVDVRAVTEVRTEPPAAAPRSTARPSLADHLRARNAERR